MSDSYGLASHGYRSGLLPRADPLHGAKKFANVDELPVRQGLPMRIHALTAFVLSVFVLASCMAAEPWPPMKTIFWEEDVRLSSGEVIRIQRGEERRRAGEPGREGWLFDTAWLRAQLPSIGESRWDGSVRPLVLDRTQGGDWYLLGIVAAYRGFEDYGVPRDKRYVAFKLTNRQWSRIPFSEFPSEFTPNLLANTGHLFFVENKPNGVLVDLTTKSRVDSRATFPDEFKRINRSLGH